MPYTFKSGDFKLLVTPSLNLSWNDNVNLSRTNALQDFIFFPALGLRMSYPLTQRNLLQLDVTFGYQEYLEHNEYSRWSVKSGSALSYDIYVKDFWINLHDRFSYEQNPSQEAAVAATGNFDYAIDMYVEGLNRELDVLAQAPEEEERPDAAEAAHRAGEVLV